jgi:large subunit ribosomal protein L28
MARVCMITGKSGMTVGGYSNRTRATQFNPTGKRWAKPNIQRKKIVIPELDAEVTLDVSARGIKTIQKKGAYRALKDAGLL